MDSQRDLFQNSQNSDEEEIDRDQRFMAEAGGNAEDQEVGDVDTEQPNDYNPQTKSTVVFQDGELAIIVDHLDSHYEQLFGHGRNLNYVRDKKKAWKALINEINNWNKTQGTGTVRGEKSVKQKIQNLMYRSE